MLANTVHNVGLGKEVAAREGTKLLNPFGLSLSLSKPNLSGKHTACMEVTSQLPSPAQLHVQVIIIFGLGAGISTFLKPVQRDAFLYDAVGRRASCSKTSLVANRLLGAGPLHAARAAADVIQWITSTEWHTHSAAGALESFIPVIPRPLTDFTHYAWEVDSAVQVCPPRLPSLCTVPPLQRYSDHSPLAFSQPMLLIHNVVMHRRQFRSRSRVVSCAC